MMTNNVYLNFKCLNNPGYLEMINYKLVYHFYSRKTILTTDKKLHIFILL